MQGLVAGARVSARAAGRHAVHPTWPPPHLQPARHITTPDSGWPSHHGNCTVTRSQLTHTHGAAFCAFCRTAGQLADRTADTTIFIYARPFFNKIHIMYIRKTPLSAPESLVINWFATHFVCDFFYSELVCLFRCAAQFIN